jgi:hypothetical protein
MTLRILVLMLAAAALAGCGDDYGSGSSAAGCIKGSGKVVTQDRTIGPFTAIELDSIGDLTAEQTGTDSLKVETDDNLQSIVTSAIKDGTLTLAERGCHNCSPTKIAFTVTAKTLQKLDLPSTGSATVAKLDGPNLTVTISGTGSVKLSGRVGSLKIVSSGTGSCDASGLVAKDVSVNLSGTGNVRISATDTLDAKDSGTGNIRYSGSPKLTQSNTGTGSIKQINP